MRVRARFVPQTDGSIELRLAPEERALLESLPSQLRALLSDDVGNSALVRLFPPAYLRNDEHDAEFHRLMREDLLARKIEVAEIVERSAQNESLSADEVNAWMGAINDLRLVIGTQIDINEDFDLDDLEEDDPRVGAYILYAHLSDLLGEMVDVMSGGF